MVTSLMRCLLTLVWCIMASTLLCLEALPVCNPYLIGSSGLTLLTDDPSAAIINPAAGESGISTASSFLYGMSSLNQYELASVLNYKNNSFIAAWQALNNDDYIRQDFRLGIRYELKSIRFGVGYKLLYDDIPGYDSEKDSRLYEGIRFKYRQTRLDLSAEHQIPPDNDKNQESQTLNLCLGQKLDSSSDVSGGFTVVNDLPVNYKLGCRFQVFKDFSALASWSSQPGRFGFGASFHVKHFNLAYGLQTHPELDWTHSIGIAATLP